MTGLPVPLRVCLYGLGQIGAAVTRELIRTPGVELAAVVDTDPKKAGRPLSAVLGARAAGACGSVLVAADAAAALRSAGAHVVVQCTGSRLPEVFGSLETILEAGLPCVSSCEELAFPQAGDPALAERLDRRAREKGVALLGTGVNPGFAMDALVLALSGAVRGVRAVRVERVLDPLSRRQAFQRKVGLGMTHDEARREVDAGRMGHVGLRHSAMLIARGLGWAGLTMDEQVDVLTGPAPQPARGRRARSTPRGRAVTGLRQVLTAREGRAERIRLTMVIKAGARAPRDTVTIDADAGLTLHVPGGVPGDQATVACLINSIPQVVAPPRPGLLTFLDLPLRPSWRPAVPSWRGSSP